MPAQEHWRLFREFGDSAAYLDIETTGLSGSRDHITTIVLYDGHSNRHYVGRDNLADFKREIWNHRLLVTLRCRRKPGVFLRRSSSELGDDLSQKPIILDLQDESRCRASLEKRHDAFGRGE